jgi:hypothetical protein
MIGTVQANPNPLTFWWYATADASVDKLRRALEMAVERWRNATGLDIDISVNAHHWVRLRPPEDMGGAWGHVSGPWSSNRIRVIDNQSVETTANLIAHEMGHVLARTNAHTDVYEDILYFGYHTSAPNIITQVALDLVAAARGPLPAPNPETVHPYA